MRAIHLAEVETKRRPVLLLTEPSLAIRLDRVVVAAITSTIRGLASEVAVGPRNGIARESVVNLQQIEWVSRSELGEPIGYLLPQQEQALRAAVVHAFGLTLD